MTRLGNAHELLKMGKLVEALEVLVDAWGACRVKPIAALVQELGALIDRSLPPIETKAVKRKVVEETWLDIAARRRAADLPRLLKVLGWASAPLLKEWTHQLSGFKPDPRIAVPLDKAANRFTSSGAGVTRTAAKRLLQKLESNGAASLSPEEARVISRIGAEIDRRMKRPPVSEEELFGDPRPSSGSGGDALLRMVLDAPSDMRARIVFGDFLSEAGDPRGELIALQANEATLSKERRRRISELIEAGAAAWIRPLDSVVRGPRFELGFLSGCEQIKFRTKLQRATLLQHPLWATVRSIDACNEDALLVSGALRSLEHLRTSPRVLAMLARSKTPPGTLASVEVSFDVEGDTTENEWAIIADVGALKNLRRLRLSLRWAYSNTPRSVEVDRFSWLFRSKLGVQLESLEIDGGYVPARLDGFLDGLTELENLRSFVVEATPPYARGGLSVHAGAGGRGIAGAPCPVRWRLTRAPSERRRKSASFRCELEIGWPYYNNRLRPIAPILAQNLRGFPRPDVPTTAITYVGRPIKATDLATLTTDVKRLLGKSFAEP